LVQKVLVVVFASLLWFLAAFLTGTTVFLSLGSGGTQANSPSDASSSPHPNMKLPEVNISSARWEGQKAVVKGSWKGGYIDAVYCKLFEGGPSGKPARGLKDTVPVQMDQREHTFSLEFVAATESEGGESLDPEASYTTECWGVLPDSSRTDGTSAKVEGTPPG
jgi:hypothetical protein